jgi:tetratricopeptide (TPR) repeat protein
MGHPTDADIQSELARNGRGLVVVGTGIAIAATTGTLQAPFASWDGLLRHGLDHCLRFARQDDAWAASLRAHLASPDATALLGVAGEICTALAAPGLGEFGRWLEDTVGAFRAARRDELEALRDLGLPLATTNYDDLLEEVTGLPAATWQDTAVVEDLLHGKPLRAILHLHGHWQRPDSVILDPAAYRRAAPVLHDLLKALRLSHTLLFVGCGEGLADPNWSALRSWSSEFLAGSRYRHFRLCLTRELPALERQHPPAERLFAVPYGAAHGDLAPFLRRLRPAAAASALALPVASRCFGRDEAIETLTAALCAVPPRPAAVLGPAGIGKSTVTLVALHQPRVAARFGSRRYFVRCAAAASRSSLLNTLALALGLDLAQATPTADPESHVLSHLAAAPALLVLDNAETPWEADLAGAAIGFEDLLARLAALPGLALAVSLRGAERPLRPSWHTTLALGPLAPDAAREAFLDVAGDVYRDDPLLTPLLAEVGHLPLALVLLAAQAEGTPLAILHQRWLQARTGMLHRPGGDPREADLEASLSLSLASPRMTSPSRRLAALLAFLPNGMADDDLQALDPEHGADASAALRKVGLALPRDPRLRLYPPIRDVFARTLPPASAEHDRLLAHYLQVAELGERAGAKGGQAAFERLAPELSNLEALLTPALAKPDPQPAIVAVLSLVELARFTGLDPLPLFEQALDAARKSGAPETIAQCLKRTGDLSLDRSDHDAARSCYEEALPLYRRVGDLLGEANCTKSLGNIQLRRSALDAARSRYEEALPLFRRIGDLLGEANCIKGLGDIQLRRSDHDAARSSYEEARPLFRRVGDLLGEANCIQGLGDIDLATGDDAGARERFEQALSLYARLPEWFSMGWTHRRLARLARAEPARQASHLRAARDVWSAIQRPDLVADLDREFPPSGS